jgi:hypothetical protein
VEKTFTAVVYQLDSAIPHMLSPHASHVIQLRLIISFSSTLKASPTYSGSGLPHVGHLRGASSGEKTSLGNVLSQLLHLYFIMGIEASRSKECATNSHNTDALVAKRIQEVSPQLPAAKDYHCERSEAIS